MSIAQGSVWIKLDYICKAPSVESGTRQVLTMGLLPSWVLLLLLFIGEAECVAVANPAQ